MGLYQRYLAPRVVDLACSPAALASWRRRVVEDLEGVVVEVGFGTGRNLRYYPTSVSEVVAVEPSSVMRRRAASTVAASPVPVRWGDLDGQALSLPDASCDAGVITFALCTIADPLQALFELRRVVKPGGRLRVLEHGHAPDESVARWQRRLEPLERRFADGCHLTRDPVALLDEAGWTIDECYQAYVKGPKPWCYFTSLRAHSASPSPSLNA